MGSIKQFTTSAPSPTTKMALKNKKSYEDYLLGGGGLWWWIKYLLYDPNYEQITVYVIND